MHLQIMEKLLTKSKGTYNLIYYKKKYSKLFITDYNKYVQT